MGEPVFNSRLKLPKPGSIKLIELIRLSLSYMRQKKARTAITVGGMAIGVGAIVFLVSIGYGLQSLVISRVARLDELRQVDVVLQQGSQARLNDESLADFRDTSNVEQVLPLISLVGRINYQNSTSDVAVFGVTTDYLKSSAIQPAQGRLFDSNDLTVTTSSSDDAAVSDESTSEGEVQGITDVRVSEREAVSDAVKFSIQPDEWIIVRSDPTRDSSVIGYTKRIFGGEQTGSFVEGDAYSLVDSDNSESVWIRAQVPLWEKQICGDDVQECDPYTELIEDNSDEQVRANGYFGLNFLTVNRSYSLTRAPDSSREAAVLGIFSDSEDLEAINSDIIEDGIQGRVLAGTLEVVDLEDSDSETEGDPTIEQVSVRSSTSREVVVNRSLLEILGISENEAIDKAFTVSFVITSNLLDDPSRKVESVPELYSIVGVIPDTDAPAMYVPFVDLRSLGISSYSQVKVVVSEQGVVPEVRGKIEARGYSTDSVLDTVEQINSLFSTLRIGLAFVGSIALVIASLGMFNTLTVSLLERTHEVGLLKAIGMKSREVKKLFLVESLTMGFLGGIIGLFFGYLAGKVLSLVLSSIAVTQGIGAIDVANIPFFMVMGVVFLALTVGILTGYYPARRATKISALDALRYE